MNYLIIEEGKPKGMINFTPQLHECEEFDQASELEMDLN